MGGGDNPVYQYEVISTVSKDPEPDSNDKRKSESTAVQAKASPILIHPEPAIEPYLVVRVCTLLSPIQSHQIRA